MSSARRQQLLFGDVTVVDGTLSGTAVSIDTIPNRSDLTRFWSEAGITQAQSNFTFIQTHAGSSGPPAGEETLDTEWSGAVPPGGKVRV